MGNTQTKLGKMVVGPNCQHVTRLRAAIGRFMLKSPCFQGEHMGRVLEELFGALLGAIVSLDNFRNAVRPHRQDDPITAEQKRLTRTWVLSFVLAMGVVVVAFILDNLLARAGAAIAPGNAFEPLQRGVFFIAAATLTTSTLSMMYCSYRLWRLERGA